MPLFLCDCLSTGRYGAPVGIFASERYARAKLTRLYGRQSKNWPVYPSRLDLFKLTARLWQVHLPDHSAGEAAQHRDGRWRGRTCRFPSRTTPRSSSYWLTWRGSWWSGSRSEMETDQLDKLNQAYELLLQAELLLGAAGCDSLAHEIYALMNRLADRLEKLNPQPQ